jgi:hypothetical protein
MGVALLVMPLIGDFTAETGFTLAGVGLFALALASFMK